MDWTAGNKVQDIISKISLRLKTARLERQDRQEDLAARTGVSRSTIVKMEQGGEAAAKVSLATWLEAAEQLGLLETAENFLKKEKNPFQEYDLKKKRQEKIKKSRARKK